MKLKLGKYFAKKISFVWFYKEQWACGDLDINSVWKLKMKAADINKEQRFSINIMMNYRMCLSSSSQKMANCNYEFLFICLCSENSGQVFKTFATVTWLKYCRYDLKLNCFFLRISRYVIDKINKNLLSEGFIGGNFFPLILIAIGEENWERYQLFP